MLIDSTLRTPTGPSHCPPSTLLTYPWVVQILIKVVNPELGPLSFAQRFFSQGDVVGTPRLSQSALVPYYSDCAELDLPMLQRIQELRGECVHFIVPLGEFSYFYSVPYTIPTRHIVKEIRHGSSRRNSGFPTH